MEIVDVEPLHFKNDPPLRPYRVALFPIRGFLYFLTTPALWKIILCPFLITFLVGLLAFILIFSLLLYPQYLAILDFHLPPWLCWIISIILCACETFLVVFLFALFFIEGTKRRIYHKVFELEGEKIKEDTSSYFERRVLKQLDKGCCMWFIGDILEGIRNFCCCFYKPDCLIDCLWMKVFAFLLFLITLPLNLIPGFGTVLFVSLNGFYFGWKMQDGYLEKKGLTFEERKYFVTKRWSEFMSFGVVCLVLNLLPLFNTILIYCNVVSAALWAVDMERSKVFDDITRSYEEEVYVPLITTETSNFLSTYDNRNQTDYHDDVYSYQNSNSLFQSSGVLTKDVNGVKVSYF